MSKTKEPEVSNNNFNRICTGTEIIGTINAASSDFRIDGYVEGSINSKGKIVIGEKARIKGDIVARNADILGTVEGTLTISELLSIKSTGVIIGNVTTRKVTIEVGAQFNGNCNMTDNIPEPVIPDSKQEK